MPLSKLRARHVLLKYLTRLVTPLLHYVDVRTFETPSLDAALAPILAHERKLQP